MLIVYGRGTPYKPYVIRQSFVYDLTYSKSRTLGKEDFEGCHLQSEDDEDGRDRETYK